MKFYAAASALLATAAAAPAPQTSDCPNPAHCGTPAPDPATYENVNIDDFTLRKNDEGIQSVSFKLSGNNATDTLCSRGPVGELPAPITDCEVSEYRWTVSEPQNPPQGEYAGITLYHQTAPFAGKWAMGNIPIYCRAGGDGIDDRICQQVGKVTVVITATG